MQARSNQQALSKLINAYTQFEAQSNIVFCDVNLIIKYISPSLADLLLINKYIPNLAGMHLYDIFHFLDRTPAVLQQVFKYVQMILHGPVSEAEFLGINLKRQPANILLHFRTAVMYNPANYNKLGIECMISPFQEQLLLVNPTRLFVPHNAPTMTYTPDGFLSRREHEVLYLNYHCRSARQVAEVLSNISGKPLSEHTINSINRKLYTKFGVYNLQALLKKAYTQGYQKRIPISLLTDHVVDMSLL